MTEYIFRQVRTEAYEDVDSSDFVVIDTLPKVLNNGWVLLSYLGPVGYLKLLVKSLGSTRLFYFIQQQNRIVACGTMAIGFCNYYAVAYRDVVIGSVWTDERCRGQGLATRSIRGAVNYMIAHGASTFFIDTQETNLAMLRSIEKMEFGKPVGSYNCGARYLWD